MHWNVAPERSEDNGLVALRLVKVVTGGSHGDDGHRDGNGRSTSASAAIVLDVGVEEILVGDLVGMGCGSKVSEKEHLFLASIDISSVLLLCGSDLVGDSSQL